MDISQQSISYARLCTDLPHKQKIYIPIFFLVNTQVCARLNCWRLHQSIKCEQPTVFRQNARVFDIKRANKMRTLWRCPGDTFLRAQGGGERKTSFSYTTLLQPLKTAIKLLLAISYDIANPTAETHVHFEGLSSCRPTLLTWSIADVRFAYECFKRCCSCFTG